MTAQRKMLMLGEQSAGWDRRGRAAPHPLANGKALEREILRVLKEEIAKVEDGAEPVELGGIQVSTRPGETRLWVRSEGRDGTHSMPRMAASPRVVLSMKVILWGMGEMRMQGKRGHTDT